ncbi:T-complex protein 1 subunit gamma [Enteropsectra breve]|nr:T-complex protein 1 subunit gamma [Enteropsectra breve]
MNRSKPKAYILVSSSPNEIQRNSAHAAKTLLSIVRTCLGPRAMQKMILTKINSIEMTNDGNSILREMDVSHPSARCLIELSQTQDNECGDGTTSVLILAAELLNKMVLLLERFHPVQICAAMGKARDVCLSALNEVSVSSDESSLIETVRASVSTKLCAVLKVPIPELALKAAQILASESNNDCNNDSKNGSNNSRNENNNSKAGKRKVLDLKTDIKIEKILGNFTECEVINGILIEKEIIHAQMRRTIESPRILLVDSSLEYKKGESVTNMEFSGGADFERALEIEEETIRKMCKHIVDIKPDLLIAEKGISDLALSILYENNITALRRVKRSDMIRIAKASGAVIMNRLEDLKESHLGKAGMFEYIKINRDNYCKISGCGKPGAVCVVLRGPSKDLLAELERNFMDAIKVCKNLLVDPAMVPGCGASEMHMAVSLAGNENFTAAEKEVFAGCSDALKIIPSILSSNSGMGNTLDILSKVEDMHSNGMKFTGVDGVSGDAVDARKLVMEPISVKVQMVKSAFGSVMQLLRVDGIIETKNR